MENIKPCPCCGHQAHFAQVGPRTIISCLHCGIKVEKMTRNKQTVIDVWNKRAS